MVRNWSVNPLTGPLPASFRMPFGFPPAGSVDRCKPSRRRRRSATRVGRRWRSIAPFCLCACPKPVAGREHLDHELRAQIREAFAFALGHSFPRFIGDPCGIRRQARSHRVERTVQSDRKPARVHHSSPNCSTESTTSALRSSDSKPAGRHDDDLSFRGSLDAQIWI